MPARRLLRWSIVTFVLCVLPSHPLAAQEEAPAAPSETPAAAEPTPAPEEPTPAPEPAPAADEQGQEDSQEAAPPADAGQEAGTPQESAPEESAPDEAAPDEAAPDESAPDESAPEEEAESEAVDPEAAAPQVEEPREPRRITGLGSVDSPQLPGQPWRVHDLFRPRPPVVEPADVDVTVPPPADAVVLFGGADLSLWGHRDREERGIYREATWKVENGYFEVTRGGGDLFTLDNFASVQLHLEWAAPEEVRGNAQGRGNSGIKFLGLYEVQILDSYNNRTYADGQAAAIYGQYPPAVNVSRAPGKWQSYDIIFEIPQFEGNELVRPGYMTVLHNGVLVHHRRELAGVTGLRDPVRYRPHPPAGPIMLQDHGNPIRFRNVWVRRLD